MRADDPRHGTYAGGRIHRADGEDVCDPCRRAEALYEIGRQLDIIHSRPRMVPANGTVLRLRALVALGHTWSTIGPALAMSPSGASAHAHRPRPMVRATTAAKVAALYDAWSMTLPPALTTTERKARTYALTVARRNGWLPPLALDDDRLDDPTYRPTKHLTPAERAELAQLEGFTYDHAVVERFLASGERTRTLTNAEAAEAYRRLVARGHSTHDIEHTWGLKSDRYTTTATTREDDVA